MKIKLNPDDNLPWNITLKLYNLTVIVRPVFQEENMNVSMIYKMLQYERIDISEGIDIN